MIIIQSSPFHVCLDYYTNGQLVLNPKGMWLYKFMLGHGDYWEKQQQQQQNLQAKKIHIHNISMINMIQWIHFSQVYLGI